MKFKKFQLQLVAVVVSGLIWSGCVIYNQTLENTVGDNYLLDFHTTKALSLALDAVRAQDDTLILSNAGDVKFEIKGGKKRVTVSYPEYKEYYDGVPRSGSWFVEWDGDFNIPGKKLKLNLGPNFKAYDWGFAGVITITNWGKDQWGRNEYDVFVDSMQTGSPAYNWDWSSMKIATVIKGQETLTSTDDKFMIWGNSWGGNRQGRRFNAVVKDSLFFDNSCPWGITKGRVDISHIDLTQRIFVDFGKNEDCNEFVTFTRGDVTQTVTKNR